MRMSNKNVGALIAIAGVVMFSAKAVMVKLGYRYEADTVTLLLLRMIFALPFYLGVMVRSTQKTNAYKLTRKDIGSIVGLGFIGYYLASYFDFYGLQFISASLERLILFIYPTLVIVISVIILKKKASRIQIYAILITYLGILLLLRIT